MRAVRHRGSADGLLPLLCVTHRGRGEGDHRSNPLSHTPRAFRECRATPGSPLRAADFITSTLSRRPAYNAYAGTLANHGLRLFVIKCEICTLKSRLCLFLTSNFSRFLFFPRFRLSPQSDIDLSLCLGPSTREKGCQRGETKTIFAYF